MRFLKGFLKSFLEVFTVSKLFEKKILLQLLRGHSDDVSRFVVRDGLVVSGGRDKTLVGWRQYGGRHYEFAFAKRY